MSFKIKNKKGIIIAEFLFKYDRDSCLDFLNDGQDNLIAGEENE